MAGKYRYYWNKEEKKKVYGGKYSNGDAGQKHSLTEKKWGVERQFEGSGTESYEFLDPKTNTIVTIPADNLEEARRIASSMGLRKLRKNS